MKEKIILKIGKQESLTQDKQETKKYPSIKQAKAGDFFYDSTKKEILIYSESEGKRKEKRHPFQEFLYELRSEEIKVSTSEWLDLQKILAEGKIQTIDDFYFISRALLVKDITYYHRFDIVFGRMFYNIEPPESQAEDENEDFYEDQEDEEVKSQQEEKEISEEENLSQEIVDPGFSEEHHGGEDMHMAIKDSKFFNQENNQVSQGRGKESDKKQKREGDKRERQKQKNKNSGTEGQDAEDNNGNKKVSSDNKGKIRGVSGSGKHKNKEEKRKIIIKGKGGYSIRERVIERRYNQFDEKQTLNYEQFSRALAKIVSIIREMSEVSTNKLDVKETVNKIAQNAGIPKFVWKEEQERKPKVILMFDVGGSTDEFRPIMEKLFLAAKDCLEDVEIYYFHNAIYGEVWPQKDGVYGKHFIPLKEILKKDSDSRVIIIGDAWMAEEELWEYNKDYSEKTKRNYLMSGIDSFKEIKKNFNYVVWINPIPELEHDEWDESGTISDIKKIFKMYDLTLSGIEKAVKELKED